MSACENSHPYPLRATQGKPDVLFLHAPATRLGRRGLQGELFAKSFSTIPSPSHFLLADLPNYREKNFYSHFLYSTFHLKKKKKFTSHPSVPSLSGKRPGRRQASLEPLSKPQISEASAHLRFISFFRIVLPQAIVCRSADS